MLNIKHILIFILLTLTGTLTNAQCPASKYGITPVWPVNWDETDRQDWYYSMKSHGMGFQSDGSTWRQVEEMMDSNWLVPFRDDVAWAKTQGGIETYVFQLRNPGPKVNFMPPLFCGNPLTDTNTTIAMFRFILNLLDTLDPYVDCFVLGSDVDEYFKTRPEQCDSFLTFAERLSNHIDTAYPNMKFSIGVTLNNTINTDTSIWSRSKSFCDFLAVSWWPLKSDYTVDTVQIDSAGSLIDRLVMEAGVKPIIIVDCGLPTSSMAGGSDSLQSLFVEKTFQTTLFNPQIEGVGWSFLANFDTTKTYWYQNYYLQMGSDLFNQSIKSRGLLDSLGVQKPAYLKYLSMLDTVCYYSALEENRLTVPVFPNPCDSWLRVGSQPFTQAHYLIYDQLGRLRQGGEIPDNQCIDVSALPSGLYYICFRNNKGVEGNSVFIKESNP